MIISTPLTAYAPLAASWIVIRQLAEEVMMGENTKIEWTHHTFNPVIGCTKVGPGCDNCYAEAWDARGLQLAPRRWGPHAPRTRTSPANWRKPIAWDKAAAAAGERHRVFCASLADVFDNAWPDGIRKDLFALIRATPNLDWMLLTKRPGNIAGMLPPDWGDGYPNVWLGCTATSRAEMLRDAPKLKSVDALVRFWSVEPLLGDIGEIPRYLLPDLVIVGGESGPRARPMHPDWVRSLRDQCVAAGVCFFMKQWGEWGPLETSEERRAAGIIGKTPRAQWHHACGLITDTGANEDGLTFFSEGQVFRVGKKATGRLLDGRTWDEMPGEESR